MAIALVQTTPITADFTGTTQTVSLSSSGSGNLLVVHIIGQGSGQNVTSVTDDKGNFYTSATVKAEYNNSGAQGQSNIWYAENCISGVTLITVNVDVALRIRLLVQEFSGVKTSSSVDVTAKGIENTGSLINTARGTLVTPALNNSLIVTSGFVQLFSITGVNSPWILLSGTAGFPFAYVIQTTAVSAQAIFVEAGADRYATTTLTFQAAIPPLTLSLSDSVSSSDLTINEDDKVLSDSVTPSDTLGVARAQNVSDSMTVTDSFTLQSDFIASNPIPKVEILTNQLVPAEVKTFFRFE